MVQDTKKKNAAMNRELKEEREHPEEIIEDVLEQDEQEHIEVEDLEPKGLEAGSTKMLIYALLIIIAIFAFFFGGKYIAEALHLGENKGVQSYNGFTFTQDAETGIWFTTYTKGSVIYPMQFRYAPFEVEDIPLLFNPDDILVNREAILQSLPPQRTGEYSVAAIEMVSKVSNVFSIPSKAGVFSAGDNVSDEVPIITCADASDTVAVIIYQKQNDTRVFELTNNCYTIQGPTYNEVVRAADRLVYGVLGIIKD